MNKYLIEGQRRQAGAIGILQSFKEKIEAPSSYDAYMTVLGRPEFELVHVTAIKMKCETCNGYHMIVPTILYLGI